MGLWRKLDGTTGTMSCTLLQTTSSMNPTRRLHEQCMAVQFVGSKGMEAPRRLQLANCFENIIVLLPALE